MIKISQLDRIDREYTQELSRDQSGQREQDQAALKKDQLAKGLYKKYGLDPSVVTKLADDIIRRGLKGLQKIKEKVFYVFFNDGGRAYIDGNRYSTSEVNYKNMIVQRAQSNGELGPYDFMSGQIDILDQRSSEQILIDAGLDPNLYELEDSEISVRPFAWHLSLELRSWGLKGISAWIISDALEFYGMVYYHDKSDDTDLGAEEKEFSFSVETRGGSVQMELDSPLENGFRPSNIFIDSKDDVRIEG